MKAGVVELVPALLCDDVIVFDNAFHESLEAAEMITFP